MSNLTTRAGKGSPLTNNELDANFTNLNSDKVEIGGDLSGTSSAPNVAKIQGRAVSADAPAIGEKLVWNGTAWEPSTDPTGEPIGHEDKSSSSISFNSGTRTFTISPVAANFVVWCKGVKYTYTSAQTVVIPDTTGLHFIYFNASGVLSTQMSYFTWEEHAPTAYVYWNSTTQQAVYFGDERHGITLDWQTHEYLHRTRGAAIASGFGASGYTTTGAGATDADAQIDIGGGTFFDEDLQVDIVSTNTPVAGTWQQDLSGPARIPVLYLSGSAWVIDAPTDFPFKVVSGVPQYNLYSGGTWSAAPVANNGYFVSWILATHNLTYPVVAVISQAATNQVSEAEAMTFEGLTLSGFPSVEFRPLYKVIYQHKTSFANNIKASTIAVYDLRSISAAGVAAALVQDHGNLSGLGDDDHAQYLHVSAVRSPSAAVTNSFLPSQASQSGKYLTTDGSNPSWGSIPSGSLTFTGDVTGTGTTGSSTTLTLSNSGAAAGTYTKVTVDAKGRVTTGALIDSSDVTTALGFTPENSANKAVANGYASLDGSGKVPSTQLPSYVDDVIEYANLAAFPSTGESGKIYIAIDTAKTYRWSGSAYVEISASPGSTDAVTEGSTNLYFTNARARGAITATGSLSYNNQTGVLSYTQPTLVSTFTNDSNYLTGITGTQVTNALGYIPPQPNGTGATGTWNISISGNAATVSSITSAQVTTALGYTPYNATNPNGYTNNTGTVTSVSGTGTVSGLTLTGSVTSSGSLELGGTLSLTSGQITSALGYTPANNISLGNYLPLSGGTMTGVLAFSSSGTAINLAGQTDSIGYNATTNLGTYIKGTGNTYLYGGGEFYDGTASRQILTSGNYSSFTVARAGGSFVGRVVFPSAVFDRPQLPGGILGLDTGDGNFDIWGISREYYPSHGTAANAWGIRWDGDSNQVRFIGAGTTRLAVDLDGGSSGLTWEGNAVLNASNYSSGYFKTVNGSSIIGTGDITVNPTQLNGYSSSSYSGPTSAVKQFFWESLTASGTQARTFEIARLGIDYNDWNTGIGPFEVELYEAYYSRGLKKKYVIYWGYSNVYGMQLVEYSGNGDNNFQARIGTPVQVSGDNYYLPVFVDVGYYSHVDVRVTTNRDITASNPPGIGQTFINASPSATNIANFSPDSTVNFASTTSVQIGGNQLLHAGNYGSYALPLGGGNVNGSINLTNRLTGILVNSSSQSSDGGSIAIQQVTAEGWTGIFTDYEPYTGWGLWHDNPNNYFCFTAESSTNGLRSFTVPSRVSGNRTAYEKVRIDQGSGDVRVGGSVYITTSGHLALHAGNYNDYAPRKDGTGANGTWNINVTGNAATVSGITSGQVTTALGYTPLALTGLAGQTSAATGSVAGGGGRWLRVATLGTNWFYGRVKIWDGSSSGPHQSKEFTVSGAFNDRSKVSFVLLAGGSYNYVGVSKVRYLSATTYDPQYLEVYIDGAGSDTTWTVAIFEPRNASAVGFSTGSVPSGYTSVEWDCNGAFAAGSAAGGFRIGYDNSAFVNGNTVLHAGNYNDYAPSKTGTGAQGTWNISITGNATSADQIDGWGFVNTGSNAGVNADTIDSNGISYYTAGVPNFTGNSTDGALYSQRYNSDWQHQIAADYRSGQIALRGKNAGNWQSWRTVLDSGNYNSYSPSLTGGGASGTWSINVTGSAGNVGGYTSDGWLRKVGDSTQFQIYGNSRTIIFRTDGVTNPHGGGGYAYIWYYGGSGDSERRLILNTSGDLWTNSYGWIHDRFLRKDTSDGISGKLTVSVNGRSTSYQTGNIEVFTSDNTPPSIGFHRGGYSATSLYESDGELYANAWTTRAQTGKLLSSGNYNSYAPTLTGGNASGTWSINITGSAGSASTASSASTATRSTIEDTRAAQRSPNAYDDYRVSYEFTNQITGIGDWHSAMTLQGWHDGYAAWQIIGPSSTSAHENFYLRSGINTSWNTLRTILHSGNYANYTIPIGGGWYGSGLPGSRWYGYSVSGGEFVLGNGLPNAGQVGVLIDGCYVAGENNGFWSMASDNTWGSRRGMYWDGTYLNFTTNSATTRHSAVYSDGNVTAYSDERVKTNWRDFGADFIERLAQVKSGIYDRTDVESLTQVGVTAQSLRPVMEHAVVEAPTGELSVAYGNAALAAAVELAKELVTLKKELAEIKSRLH